MENITIIREVVSTYFWTDKLYKNNKLFAIVTNPRAIYRAKTYTYNNIVYNIEKFERINKKQYEY